MAVATVDSVMLSRDPDSPMTLIIHVAGTVPSSGWTEPQLMAETDASADMTVRTYRLEATSPATASANATPQSLETELRVDDLPPEVKTIRIIAGSNDISAPVTD